MNAFIDLTGEEQVRWHSRFSQKPHAPRILNEPLETHSDTRVIEDFECDRFVLDNGPSGSEHAAVSPSPPSSICDPKGARIRTFSLCRAHAAFIPSYGPPSLGHARGAADVCGPSIGVPSTLATYWPTVLVV